MTPVLTTKYSLLFMAVTVIRLSILFFVLLPCGPIPIGTKEENQVIPVPAVDCIMREEP